MPVQRFEIPEDVLLPHAYAAKLKLKTDPENWHRYEIECLRTLCGCKYAGVPLDDIRAQCCNFRKRGLLPRTSETANRGQGRILPRPANVNDEYYQSDHWQRVRAMVHEFWGNKCALCACGPKLHVHHNNYDCLWKETLQDVVPLCPPCHKMADRRRRRVKAEMDASLFCSGGNGKNV